MMQTIGMIIPVVDLLYKSTWCNHSTRFRVCKKIGILDTSYFFNIKRHILVRTTTIPPPTTTTTPAPTTTTTTTLAPTTTQAPTTTPPPTTTTTPAPTTTTSTATPPPTTTTTTTTTKTQSSTTITQFKATGQMPCIACVNSTTDLVGCTIVHCDTVNQVQIVFSVYPNTDCLLHIDN